MLKFIATCALALSLAVLPARACVDMVTVMFGPDMLTLTGEYYGVTILRPAPAEKACDEVDLSWRDLVDAVAEASDNGNQSIVVVRDACTHDAQMVTSDPEGNYMTFCIRQQQNPQLFVGCGVVVYEYITQSE